MRETHGFTGEPNESILNISLTLGQYLRRKYFL